MADLTMREFSMRWTFIFVAVFGLLAFAINFPAINGQDSILLDDPRMSDSFEELGLSLDEYQTDANIDQNISVAGVPTIGSESIQVESMVGVNRREGSRATGTMEIMKNLVGNVLGFSAGDGLSTILLALVSIFTINVFYLIWRNIRTGN